MKRISLATVWLGGCSGCHMAFLDLDEWLFELARQVDIVFSPLMDRKAYPPAVDVALVEGAVANHDHLEMIRTVRRNTTTVIALGDCAISGNVTALRNPLGSPIPILQQVYHDRADLNGQLPRSPGIVPILLDQVQPLHQVIAVDLWLPGCPPPAPRIRAFLEQLLSGARPSLEGPEMLRFG
jgi:NAD-reducing hydrogenase small subunit